MKRIFFLLCILLLIGCTTETPKEYSLLKFVPQNAAIVLQINDLESFRSELKNNQLLQSFKKPQFKQDLNAFVSYLDYLQPNSTSLISFSEVGKEKFEYMFVTKNHENLIALDSTKTATQEIPYEGNSILKTTVNDRTTYTFMADSIFVNSSSQLLIENCIRSYKKVSIPASLKKVYATVDENSAANVLTSPKELAPFLQYLFPQLQPKFIAQFGEHAAVDVSILPDEISLTGIITEKDSLSHMMSSLKNTSPREQKVARVIPPLFDYFSTITFDSYKNFQPRKPNDLLDALEEVSSFSFNGNTFTSLRFISSSNEAITQLKNQPVHSETRYFPIYQNTDTALFENAFAPFIKSFSNSYFMILDEFIVFTNEEGIKDLSTISILYKNEQTLTFQENYQATIQHVSDESSLMLFVNLDTFKKTIAESAQKPYQKEIKTINVEEYPFAVLQFTNEKGANYAHIHGMLKRNTVKPAENSVSQFLNIVLDAPVATQPQFVKNHVTKRKEIVVQDEANMLYLISTKGKVLWKKQLDGRILGNVSQVDLYKNGRLQLALTTPQTFYVLDRNGNDVKPYPTKAKTTYTQPVSIFDYDRSKNYRFVFTEGNKVMMRDKKGDQVTGFKFSGAETNFINPPKHFRVQTKDYIVLQESNGTLHILSRVGKPRITPKETIEFSNNEVYIHNNLFTTSNENGELIQIDSKGQIERTKLPVESNHHITMTTKTLVSFSENKLHIKDKTVELAYGLYSKPQVFLIRNKIYVTITDKDAQKVYLFDSNAEPIPGFPVYGSSAIDLENFDKDTNLELVTQGEKNTVLVYKLN